MLVLLVVLFSVDLFMLLQVLRTLEGFLADLFHAMSTRLDEMDICAYLADMGLERRVDCKT